MADTRVPPWAHGPAEVFRHAEGHFHEDGDTDRRLALIGFDNAIEVCVDTFVGLHPRHRGGYEIRGEERPNILRNYHSKLGFLERYATERGLQLGDVSVDDVIWYHELRNELYHSGNGMVPERRHLVSIREAARTVFRALFGCDVVDEPGAAAAEEALTPPTVRTGSSDVLAFLSAYITLERAVTGGEGSRKRPFLQAWQDYAGRHEWAREFDDLVTSARSARNALVHGQDRSPSEGLDLEDLARELSTVAERMAEEPPGEATEPPRTALRGRALATVAYDIARRYDPERRGLTTLEFLDLLTRQGVPVKGDEPGRSVYEAVRLAHDLFERVDGGRHRWRREPATTAGVSGRQLLAALLAGDRLPDRPLHYQEMIALLEHDGIAVKGADKGSTMRGALNGREGRTLFRRVGRGLYERVP